LSGDGTLLLQHSVALSWDSSTSIVAGYNVYRGTKPGGPYGRINSTLQPGTNYTDASVQSGVTYYYVATAEDANSQESPYSNETVAAIP
jgi:fibronectin type 3 domain-containing protein